MSMIFSASRIEKLIACERKWAAHYLVGFREGATDATDIGKETHDQMEKLVRFGRPIDMTVRSGVLAAALEPHIRQYIQKPGVLCEGEFFYEGRHRWTGYKDLEAPGLVLDYKTSSDPLKWKPSEFGLRHDPQAILYAQHHFARYPELTYTELRWLYVHKRKPYRVHPVSVHMSRDHARRGFDVLESLADHALTLTAKNLDDILLLKANNEHCGAYRGCPHRQLCGTFNWSLGR